MTIQLGDIAPDFKAQTTEGDVHFHAWLGDHWGLLFSHPKDFTPVCTTELGQVAAMKDRLDQRSVKAIGLSVDTLEDHKAWAKDIEDVTGHALNFPLIADPERKVAEQYGMIHPKALDTATVRSVFVVGPDKEIKLIITYPASTGRNFEEILRTIDSLQLTQNDSLATPANWVPGEHCIIAPSVSDQEAADRFPGFKTIKPYLRTTPQPS